MKPGISIRALSFVSFTAAGFGLVVLGACSGGDSTNAVGGATDPDANISHEDTSLPYGGIDGWTRQPIGEVRSVMGIWGSSSTDVYAVGEAGMILHSSGNGSWVPQDSGTTQSHLVDIWGSGSGDLYVLGQTGGANRAASILHSAGNGSWTTEGTNVLPSITTLSALWGSGPKDVYAVGEAGAILHSTGVNTWTKQATGAKNLSAIWGSGSGDVYAVGEAGTILHSTGDGTWTPQTSGTTMYLVAIWGSGSGDVYAIGSESVGLAQSIFHSSGNGTWIKQDALACADSWIEALWGSSATDIYAIGHNEVRNGADGVLSPQILHSSGGGAWTNQTRCPASAYPDVPGTLLRKIWGSSATDVYVVGIQGTILHRP